MFAHSRKHRIRELVCKFIVNIDRYVLDLKGAFSNHVSVPDAHVYMAKLCHPISRVHSENGGLLREHLHQNACN